MEVTKRSAAIDMVKGLSILTLFFLHFENGAFEYNYNIFLVRSAAFYMVVGWLWGMSSHNRTIKEHWHKRKQGLIKPYIYLSIIFLIFDIITVLCGFRNSFIIWRDIYKTLCLRGIGTLWFLPALLAGEIVFLYIRNRSYKVKIASYLLCTAIIFLYEYFKVQYATLKYFDIIHAPIHFVFDALQATLFISVAYYVARKWGKRIMSQTKTMLFIEGIILLGLSFTISNFIPIIFEYMINLEIANTLAGFGILFLFTAIESFGAVSKPLQYFGKNSLIIMSFHFCILFQIALIFDEIVLGHDQYYGTITLIYFGIALLAQILLIEIINRKFKFIIGK